MSIAAVRGIGVAVITSTSGLRSSPEALAAQQVALLDAESMLLVDHRHTEVGELHTLVDEGVRSDDEVDRAVAQACGDASTFRRRGAVREQLHAHRPLTTGGLGLGDGQSVEERARP